MLNDFGVVPLTLNTPSLIIHAKKITLPVPPGRFPMTYMSIPMINHLFYRIFDDHFWLSSSKLT